MQVNVLKDLAGIARDHGIEVRSCAEDLDLEPYGIFPGSCIDPELIAQVFGITVDGTKDPGQREKCRCTRSRDIGMYDTCLFCCQYCYATSDFDRAGENYASHDPQAPALIGRCDVPSGD